MPKPLTKRQAALLHGWRSGLEEDIATSLTDRGAAFEYETLVLEWTPEQKVRRYTPDFIITTASGNTIVVESKGRWTREDRMKMKCVVEQHPDVDIRMVFQNLRARISKTSRTTYEQWCHQHLGIPCAQGDVPTEWILE